MWVIKTSVPQGSEAGRQRGVGIFLLHFILNAMCPTDTTVQMVARFQESRGGCYSCFQSYQDRKFAATRCRRRPALEHNLEDEALRAGNIHGKVLSDCSPPCIRATHESLQEGPTSATRLLSEMLYQA